MVRMLVLAGVLMLAAASVAAQPQHKAIPSGVLPDGMGVNIHFTDPQPGEMKMLAAGGFTWVRMDFNWDAIESVKGSYDFSSYDTLIRALEPHGMHAIFILDYSNRHYDGGQSPCTEDGRQGMARWAAAAARHFAGKGVLWEMYNEPNIGFWRPKVNSDDYIKLALAVGKAIRESAPDECYVGPATSTIDWQFLEKCFANGLLEYWDAVTVHPYRQQAPETVAPNYQRLRALIAKYAPKGRTIPMISGEWGYSSAWGGMDPVKQGKMLPRELLVNYACGVPLSIWYDWHDDGSDPKEPEHHFGTTLNPTHAGRDPIYDPKPAYLAAQTLAAQLKGYRFSKRLVTASDDDWILLFEKPGKAAGVQPPVKLVAWTVSTTPRQVRLAVSPGAFSVVQHDGAAAPPVQADAKGLQLDLTDTPRYLTPLGRNASLLLLGAWQKLPDQVSMDARAAGSLPCRIQNPFSKPMRVTARLKASVAGVASGAEHAVDVRPGETGLIVLPFTATRSPDPVTLAVDLTVTGYGRLTQTTQLVVTNPLAASVVAPADGKQPVRIQNPSGQEFSGHVDIAQVAGGLRKAVSLPLSFKAGETETTVSCPAVSGSGPVQIAVTIREDGAASQVTLPPTTLRTVDTFAAVPIDEAPEGYALTPDGDAKVASRQSVVAALPSDGPPMPGMAALRIDYQFDAGWKFICLRPTDPKLQAIEGKPRSLGLWVYGDGQGNSPRLRFVDAAGQTFQPGAEGINWTGWRWITMPMDGTNSGHWGGPDNGIIKYPIRWDTLLLLDGVDRKPTEGRIYIAGPTLFY